MNDYMNQKHLLQQKERELNGKDDIMGISALSFPAYISAARRNMFSHHVKQFNNIQNPQIPKVSTNYESVFGKYSSGYYKMKDDAEVHAIVNKYGNNRENGYFMFVYYPKSDTYDVIERKALEDLTERYGFEYNNEFMDSLTIGDNINEGDVVYKSTSYDEYMNYRYGANFTYMYSLDPNTIEDAVTISESMSRRATSTEVETFRVPINDNVLLLNLYDDVDNKFGGYKMFPEVGEYTNGPITCSARQIHNSRILRDLSDDALKRVEFSRDKTTYVEGKVIDITIYSNKHIDEIPDAKFTRQIKYQLGLQEEFHNKILEVTNACIATGSKCTTLLRKLKKKAENYLDPDIYWADNNRAFSNMIIEFTIARREPLKIGQKITGNIAPSNREVC